jgi:CRP-like cAMP-binding protein
LTAGSYFGETGLLTGKPTVVELSALTRVTLYQIPKEALAPLLRARPAMVDELSTVLAYRQLMRYAALHANPPAGHEATGLVTRLASSIQHLFALH